MQQLSGSTGRASAQRCCCRASAGAISPEPNTSRGSRWVFVDVFRGPGGLVEILEEGALVLRGPLGVGALCGVATVGRGEDRRRE